MGFIVKIVAISVLLTVAIKYGGPILPIQDNPATVLIIITAPSMILAIVLGWRWYKSLEE